MKKLAKLRICDWLLLFSLTAILASGIQLEVTHSEGTVPVWIHIIIGCLFMALIAYHLYLHFGTGNWFVRIRMQKSVPTKIFWWVGLITLVTGIVAAVHRVAFPVHSPIGGVHGKLGFLMVILSVAHVAKRYKFFTSALRK